jgi:signal peptidase II
MMQRRSIRSIAVMVFALGVCTAADLGSKAWAERELSVAREPNGLAVCEVGENGRREMQRRRQGAVVLVDGWLELRYAENCGAAFSMLSDAPPWLRAIVFYGAAGVFVSVLLWMFVQGHGGVMFVVSVPLLASGALGNLIDRIRLGYVVDFIRVFHAFDSGPWEYPTFNIADVAIFVGGALLLLDGMRKPQAEKSTTPALDAAAG